MTEAQLLQLGHRWIEVWNNHDLESILDLYSIDAEMTSPVISHLKLSDSGVLKGREALQKYWSYGLRMLPNLHFAPLDVSTSPNSMIIRYRNERNHTICEYLRIGSNGKIVQGSAHHLSGN